MEQAKPECGVPEGLTENSPAFQRRVRSREKPSPEGTAEPAVIIHSAVPSGLHALRASFPALKRRAILDHPFGIPVHCGFTRFRNSTFNHTLPRGFGVRGLDP